MRAARRQLFHGPVRRRRQGCCYCCFCCSRAVVRRAEAASLVVAPCRRPRRGHHWEPRAGLRDDGRLRHEPDLRAGRISGLRLDRGRRRGQAPAVVRRVRGPARARRRARLRPRGPAEEERPPEHRQSAGAGSCQVVLPGPARGVRRQEQELMAAAARRPRGGGRGVGGRAVVRGLHLRHLPRAQPADGAHLRRPRRGFIRLQVITTEKSYTGRNCVGAAGTKPRRLKAGGGAGRPQSVDLSTHKIPVKIRNDKKIRKQPLAWPANSATSQVLVPVLCHEKQRAQGRNVSTKLSE
uniref:Uncharacterized protein n=1 Tax=Triticum urartu TaxID=4572 RepID=A0A8R7QJ25_TRIUA